MIKSIGKSLLGAIKRKSKGKDTRVKSEADKKHSVEIEQQPSQSGPSDIYEHF